MRFSKFYFMSEAGIKELLVFRNRTGETNFSWEKVRPELEEIPHYLFGGIKRYEINDVNRWIKTKKVKQA